MTTRNPKPETQDFHSRFEAFSRARRALLNAALAYRWGTAALLAGIAALLLLGGRVPEGIGLPAAWAVNLALFAATAVALGFAAASYLRRRASFRSHMHEAFEMERLAKEEAGLRPGAWGLRNGKAAPAAVPQASSPKPQAAVGLNSRLVSALDFLDQPEPDDLMRVVIRRAAEDAQADFERRLDRRARDRARLRLVLTAGLFLGLACTSWCGVLRTAGTLRTSLFAAHEFFWPVVFEVSPPPGTHVYKLGEEVPVSIRFAQRGYEEVTLVDRCASGASVAESPNGRTTPSGGNETTVAHRLRVDGNGVAQHVLRGTAEAEHRLHFEFGVGTRPAAARRSEEIVIVFADFPVLENMQTELVYPVYTRMLPRTLEGVQRRLYGLAGTKMRLGFTFSKPLRWARFTWLDAGGVRELNLDVDGRYAHTALVHNEARTVTLEVEDTHGMSLQHPVEIEFEVQVDERPQVILPGNLKSDMPMLQEGIKLFGFGARLKDDFGVTRAVLKWRKGTVDDPTHVTQQGEVERTIAPPLRTALVTFEKVFENVSVLPGDKITFWIEVYDNRYPEPQQGESQRKSVFVYQQDMDQLYVLGVSFGGIGRGGIERIAKSKRERSVIAPLGMKTIEQLQNTYDADITTTTRPPQVRGPHVQAVKDYFRLVSTAAKQNEEEQGDE